MVKIEVNGPLVHTEIEGDTDWVCVEAVLAMNGIYCHIIEDSPSMAGPLRNLIMEQVLNGTLFKDEDNDESGTLDDIPETATKSRP